MRGSGPGYSQKGIEIMGSCGSCCLTNILQEFWLSRSPKNCRERGLGESVGLPLLPPQKVVGFSVFNLKSVKTMHLRFNCIIVEGFGQEGTSQDSIEDMMVG